MNKQSFIKTLNERLDAIREMAGVSEVINLSSVEALLKQIIKDADQLDTGLPPTENDQEVIDLIRGLGMRFKAHELKTISHEFNTKLQAGNVTLPVPLTPDDVLDFVVIQSGGLSFHIVKAIVAYRNKHKTGLYETKTGIEQYCVDNRDLLNKILSEKYSMNVELAFVRF